MGLERVPGEQEGMRRAMQEERARLATAERERLAKQQVAPVTPPLVSQPLARRAAPPLRRPVARTRVTSSRRANRERRFQRAAVMASVVALVAMLGFAAAINIHPGAPIP